MTDETEQPNLEGDLGQDDLVGAINEFRSAEKALRQFQAAADDLRTAQDDLQEAGKQVEAAYADATNRLQTAYEDASTRLQQAHKGVADATSAVFRLSEELTGIARDLADATQVIRKFEPEKVHRAIQGLDERHTALDERISHLDLAHASTHRELEALQAAHQEADDQRQALAAAVKAATRWAITGTLLIVATLVLVIVL